MMVVPWTRGCPRTRDPHGYAGSERLWTLDTGLGYRDGPYDVVGSADGRRWLSLGPGAKMEVWQFEPWAQLATFEFESAAINVAALDPTGSLVACAPWRSHARVEVWSVETQERVARLTGPGPDVMTLEFSPDGSRLSAGGTGGWIHTWRTDTWARRATHRTGAGIRYASASSANGDWIVVARSSARGSSVSELWSWRRSDRRWRTLATKLPGDVRDLAIGGERLAVAMDTTMNPAAGVYLWSEAEGLRALGQDQVPPEGHSLAGVAIDRSGERLLAVGGMACTPTGVSAWTLTGDGPLRPLDLRADGRTPPGWLHAAVIDEAGNMFAGGMHVVMWDRAGTMVARRNFSGPLEQPGGISLCG